MVAALNYLDRRLLSISFALCTLLPLLTVLKLRTWVYPRSQPNHHHPSSTNNKSSSIAQHLLTPHLAKVPFVTLLFGSSQEMPMLQHNCRLLSANEYQFDIYTDNTSHAVCHSCNCIRFQATGCRCPKPEHTDCSLCEKLAFIVSLMKSREELVFIDSDLIILKDEFLPALASRMKHFDFLASYGHGNTHNWHYTAPFNSGLMFMRRLPALNYSDLMTLMHDMGTNNDQNVISQFVHRNYQRWDSLSLKWHCRYLYKEEHDINFTDCFTFHGKYDTFRRMDKDQKFLLDKE